MSRFLEVRKYNTRKMLPKRVWTFTAFLGEEKILEKKFTDHTKMKMFSAKHSAKYGWKDGKRIAAYHSTYTDNWTNEQLAYSLLPNQEAK